MRPRQQLSAAAVSLIAVPSEDGRSWCIQMAWDHGRLEHILCFDSREGAEGWINIELTASRGRYERDRLTLGVGPLN